jgi:hypothetical protein
VVGLNTENAIIQRVVGVEGGIRFPTGSTAPANTHATMRQSLEWHRLDEHAQAQGDRRIDELGT